MTTNTIFKYGFFIMVAVAILIYVFKGQDGIDKQYVKSLEEKVENLQQQYEAVEARNNELRTTVLILKDSITGLDSELSSNDERYKAAIRYYEKRINSRDNATTGELDSLFAARYSYVIEESSN